MTRWAGLPLKSRLYAITLLTVLSAMVGLAVIVDIATRQAIFRSIDGELFRRAEDFGRVARQRPGGRPGDPRLGDPRQGDPRQGDPRSGNFAPMMGMQGGDGNRLQGQDPDDSNGGPNRRGPNGGGPMGEGPGFGGPRGGGMGMFMRGPNTMYAPRFIPADERDNGVPAEFRRGPYDPKALQQSLPNRLVYSDIEIEKEPVRALTFPVFNDEKRIGTIQAVYPLSDFLGSMNRLRMVLLTVILPLALGLSLVGARLIVGLIERPLRVLNVEAEAIQGDQLDRRLPVVGNDEFAQLSRTVNQMIDRIELTVVQEREAKQALEALLERQKRFTADASHELKTPIAVIKAHAGLLKTEQGLTDDARESIESIDESSDRMTRLVKNLLLLARLDSRTPATVPQFKVDVNETLLKAVDAAQKSTGTLPIPIETNLDPNLAVMGSQDDLLRLFQNLIENALKYGSTPASGPIQISGQVEGGNVVVIVRDHGPGIAAEHVPHLFERFYRVDKSRSTETGGTGLGLSISHEIVRSHGGELSVESEIGKGTAFRVSLPGIA